MGRRAFTVLPETEENIMGLGNNIRYARKRRNLSKVDLSMRAGISRVTLAKIEKGDPNVAIGAYAEVLHALDRLDRDLLLVAKTDDEGRRKQDFNLIMKTR